MARHKITKRIEFCYGHRLLGHEGKCRHLHGHNGLLEVDVESKELDNRGMVMDFSELRDLVKGWIDENLDHKMVLDQRDPAVSPLRALGEPMFLMDETPTAENISRLIFYEARKLGVPVCEVRLWETPSSCSTFRDDDFGMPQ